MQLRTANPILPYLAAAFIVGFTPVLLVFAILVYKIIRPQERLGEPTNAASAEERCSLRSDAIEHCATCGRKVHEEWILCPTCRTRLKRVCPKLQPLVGFEWTLCAWCGRDFERAVGAGRRGGGGRRERRGGRERRGSGPAPRVEEPRPPRPRSRRRLASGPGGPPSPPGRDRAQPDPPALSSPDPPVGGHRWRRPGPGAGRSTRRSRRPGLYVAGWGLAVAGSAALFVGLRLAAAARARC